MDELVCSVQQTALSQSRNLLFVAHDDEIHVFEPVFPEQILLTKPLLIIKSPFAVDRDTHGYIEPGKPNGINHLIVGDLGNEEILVRHLRYRFACCLGREVLRSSTYVASHHIHHQHICWLVDLFLFQGRD